MNATNPPDEPKTPKEPKKAGGRPPGTAYVGKTIFWKSQEDDDALKFLRSHYSADASKVIRMLIHRAVKDIKDGKGEKQGIE